MLQTPRPSAHRYEQPIALPTHVVALHECTSGPAQWRPMSALAGRGWVWHTPDLAGSHADATAPSQGGLSLTALQVLRDLDMPADQDFHLIGHGFGAAVAIQMALQRPRRVRSLVLYEPMAFGALVPAGRDDAWQTARRTADAVAELIHRKEAGSAARLLASFLHGGDAWAAWPTEQRHRWATQAPAMVNQLEAAFSTLWRGELLAMLRMPVTVFTGEPTSSAFYAVAETLAARFSNATLRRCQGADHMTPITQPARISCALLGALDATRARVPLPENSAAEAANATRLMAHG